MDWSRNGIFVYNETLEERHKHMPMITDIGMVEALLRSAIKSTTKKNIDRLNCIIYVCISYMLYQKCHIKK